MRDRRAAAAANAARGDLIDRVGADRVWIGGPARERCGLPEGADPVAVVRPSHAEHVQLVLKIARARHLPVIVRSGLPAVIPDELAGAVVLDARGLDRPPAIDIGRRVVTVGAGVPVHAVDRAARQARLCLRGVPALRGDATVGALISAGATGGIGLGDGSLLADLVSVELVAGSGRRMQAGHASLLASVPWRSDGLPDPSGMLVGAAGRLGVLCEVTLRLQPAPWVAWSVQERAVDRGELLAILSAARQAMSKRVVDTVLVEEGRRLAVRAATWRGEADVEPVCAAATAAFARHGLSLGDWQPEGRRVRLGHEAGDWPQAGPPPGALFEVRSSWPDASKVLDVSDALIATADADAPRVRRSWAMGADYVRVRHRFAGPGSARHPLVTGARHLLDAGAVPTGLGGAMRAVARERMSPASKVLLTGLSRAWDPDGVLGNPAGLV